jgi:hypothetical protein
MRCLFDDIRERVRHDRVKRDRRVARERLDVEAGSGIDSGSPLAPCPREPSDCCNQAEVVGGFRAQIDRKATHIRQHVHRERSRARRARARLRHIVECAGARRIEVQYLTGLRTVRVPVDAARAPAQRQRGEAHHRSSSGESPPARSPTERRVRRSRSVSRPNDGVEHESSLLHGRRAISDRSRCTTYACDAVRAHIGALPDRRARTPQTGA